MKAERAQFKSTRPDCVIISPKSQKLWCRHGEVTEGLSGVGILPSSYNKGQLAEGIPFRKILRNRSRTDKRRQEEGLREKQNEVKGLGWQGS